MEQARNNKTNNRVYALKFSSTKKVHFYWMQEPNADKDKELADKVNAMINGESPAASGGIGQMDQAQLMAMLTQAHSPGAAESANPPASESDAIAAPASDTPANDNATGGEASAGAGAGASAGADASASTEADAEATAGDDKMKVDEEPKP